MKKRKLGRTGLNVTQLSFGAMEIRGKKTWGGRDVSDKQAETILNSVLDGGDQLYRYRARLRAK